MPLSKLNILIPQEGYSLDEGEAVLRAKLSSGPGRQRLDMLDAAIEADVSLMLDPGQYQYWRAFHRLTLARGSLPFLVDLIVETADVEEHQVQIIPGTYRTTVRGTAHMVQFRLEVMLNHVIADDATIIMLYGLYGDQANGLLDALEKLVNFDIPSFVP